MQIKTNRQSVVSETSPSPSSSSSAPASASSSPVSALSLVCLDNNRIRKQIKCNMLLELNTINVKKNINSSPGPGSNYTDIACNHSCGCMSNSSCSHSAYCCCSACFTTAAAYCHSNCCLMSPSSASTKDNSNYMHCANSSRIAFNMYTPTVDSESTSNNKNNNKNNSCNNNDNNVDNRDCSSSVGECNSLQRTISNINSNLNGLIKFATIFIFLAMCDSSQAALNNVNLFIEPPAVRRSQSVILRCQYILEGAPLYSVKFYRGQLEFFRYTPGEYPNTKVFHYPGIKVDESVSNATQVVIRNVNFGLSGNFSCEVTADAPLFSTATAYAQMQVVEFPDKRPQLLTEHTRYEPGDVLRANCSTPPSRPRAELRFTINNIPVSSEETQYIRTVDNLIASRLSLKVQLQAVHFAAAAAAVTGVGSNAGSTNSHMTNALSPGGTVGIPATYSGGSGASGGPLLLRCTAQIGDLYQEYKEIELGTPQKDPVPARVTSSDGGFRGFLETYFGPSSGANTSTDRLPFKILFANLLLITVYVTLSGRR